MLQVLVQALQVLATWSSTSCSRIKWYVILVLVEFLLGRSVQSGGWYRRKVDVFLLRVGRVRGPQKMLIFSNRLITSEP
jgi:hypothetical protein